MTQSEAHQAALVEAIGRCCGYLIDDALKREMSSQRLRFRAGSNDANAPNGPVNIRHPVGQVKRLRSTSRLVLPCTMIADEEGAESLSVEIYRLLDHLPETDVLKTELCGVFDELVTIGAS